MNEYRKTVEEQKQEYENQRKYSSQANFVINRLAEIKQKSGSRRWFWELAQNASDTDKSVDIKVVLEKNQLVFEHNGESFSYKDAMNLIVPDTDKKSNSDQNEEEAKTPVGQFGTGFISTHILSLRVEVEGYLAGGEDSEAFKFTLNRSPKDDKGSIIKNMADTEKEFEESRSKCILPCDAKTRFTYLFNTPFTSDKDSFSIAQEGIAELPAILPYVLSLRPDILSITIVDRSGDNENVQEYRIQGEKPKGEGIERVDIVRKTFGSEPVSTTIFLSSVGNTSVALKYDPSSNEISGCGKDLPRLFFSFPMVGTEEFPFPLVLNNSSKYEFFPATERNGIYLESGGKGEKNRRVLEQGRDAYFNLIDYAIKQGWQKLYHFVDQNIFKKQPEKDIEEWYDNAMRKKSKDKLLLSTIVESKYGLIPLKEARFPSDNQASGNDNLTKDIFKLASSFTPVSSMLPKEELLEAWNKRLSFQIFNQQQYTLKDLKKHASECCSLQTLQERLESEPVEWLNNLISCLIFRKSNLDENPVLPCQNHDGKFQILDDLYSCSDLDENLDKELLKDLIESQGSPIRARLIHEDIKNSVITNKEHFLELEKDFIDPISKYFKERPSAKSITDVLKERKKPLLKLLAIIPNNEADDSEARQQVYQVVQKVFKNDMPAQQTVTGWPSKFWVEADRLLFEYLATRLDGASLGTIGNIFPCLEEQGTAKEWHLAFIRLIANQKHRDLLEDKALLPAQDEESAFCKVNSYFYIDDQVEPSVKEALAKFGNAYDWRPTLLDTQYNRIFSDEEQKKLFFGGRVKTSQKASDRINLIISNHAEGKEGYENANVQAAAFYLISYHITPSGTPDEKRRQLWEFSKALFKESAPDKNDIAIETFEWEKMENWLLERLVKEISEIGSQISEDEKKKSLDFLNERLSPETEEAISSIDWLNQFLTLISEDEEFLLNKYAILPNRSGNFDNLSELSSNYETEETEGSDYPTRKRQIVPDEVLKTLQLVARNHKEDKNNNILHEEIKFEIAKRVSLRDICNIIDEALSEERRGFSDEKCIKSAISIIKDYIRDLDLELAPKLFPTLHAEIYKMAINAMGEVAKHAIELPSDLLKRMGDDPTLVRVMEAFSDVDDETLAQISSSPDKVKNLKKALSISDKDITGISENRDAYIIEEAKKLLERIKSGEAVDGSESFDSETLESLVKSLSSNPSLPVAEHNATTNEHHERLGKWGEQFINTLLKEKKASSEIHDFEWVNMHRESGKPYDFKIKDSSGAGWEYVDVKTTGKGENEPYYITNNEWKKIFKEREHFTIYRVYDADLAMEAEQCSTAGYYEETPFKILMDWIERQVFELCRRNGNSSTLFGPSQEMELK